MFGTIESVFMYERREQQQLSCLNVTISHVGKLAVRSPERNNNSYIEFDSIKIRERVELESFVRSNPEHKKNRITSKHA